MDLIKCFKHFDPSFHFKTWRTDGWTNNRENGDLLELSTTKNKTKYNTKQNENQSELNLLMLLVQLLLLLLLLSYLSSGAINFQFFLFFFALETAPETSVSNEIKFRELIDGVLVHMHGLCLTSSMVIAFRLRFPVSLIRSICADQPNYGTTIDIIYHEASLAKWIYNSLTGNRTGIAFHCPFPIFVIRGEGGKAGRRGGGREPRDDSPNAIKFTMLIETGPYLQVGLFQVEFSRKRRRVETRQRATETCRQHAPPPKWSQRRSLPSLMKATTTS